jgi:hypothetical protein
VDRYLYNLPLLPDTLLVGDFNTRHQSWEPTSSLNSSREDTLYSWIEENHLLLRNTPGVGTFYRPHIEASSVMDLTLTKGALSRQELNWHTIDIGSDHLAISVTIPTKSDRTIVAPAIQAYDTKKADWELFGSLLKQKETTILYTPDLELLATTFTNAISEAVKASIPRSRKSPRSKPWWTPELRERRKGLVKSYKDLFTSTNDRREDAKTAYLLARNSYFQAIKGAKRDHWNSFLEKTDPKSIFKAMSYTKPLSQGLIPSIEGKETFDGKCKALRKTLFPKPPLDAIPTNTRRKQFKWDWEPVSNEELE